MPFSIIKKLILSFIYNKKNKPYSLQVSRQKKLKKTQNKIIKKQLRNCSLRKLKRVFLSTSYKGDIIAKGSMTVEASIVTMVFLFSVLAISSFLCVIKVQQDIRINLENIARKMAQTIYYEEQLYELGENTEIVQKIKTILEKQVSYFTEDDQEELVEKISDVSFDIYTYAKFVTEMGVKEIDNSYIAGGVLGLDFSGSKYDKDSGTVELVLNYTINVPYISQKLFSIDDCQKVYVKVWNGNSLNQNVDVVYITSNGEVYHTSKECPHININIKKTTYSDVKTLRNDAGARYSECELCRKETYGDYTVVYITDYGTRFHNTLSCGGISRTVMAVDISEIGNRTLCKTCQGGDEK